MKIIDTKTANSIYDVAVYNCGASENLRQTFVHYIINNETCEFRFQGDLGFGGKIYVETNRWRISCYPEDKTDELDKKIKEANKLLSKLMAKFNNKR